MTFDELKKYTIKRCLIMGGVAALLLGIYLTISGIRGSMEAESDKTKKAVANTNNDIHTLEEQYTKAKASVDLYETLRAENGNPEHSLSRRNAKVTLDKLNERYHLNGLKLKMTPVLPLEDARFKRNTITTEGSQVTLAFSGITDEYLLKFVSAVSDELSGYVRIDHLKLNRDKPITNDVLLAASRGEYPPLVSGELDFRWLGLKDTKAAGAAESDAESDLLPESESDAAAAVDQKPGDAVVPVVPAPSVAPEVEGSAPVVPVTPATVLPVPVPSVAAPSVVPVTPVTAPAMPVVPAASAVKEKGGE